jgi:hypothetical protein
MNNEWNIWKIVGLKEWLVESATFGAPRPKFVYFNFTTRLSLAIIVWLIQKGPELELPSVENRIKVLFELVDHSSQPHQKIRPN